MVEQHQPQKLNTHQEKQRLVHVSQGYQHEIATATVHVVSPDTLLGTIHIQLQPDMTWQGRGRHEREGQVAPVQALLPSTLDDSSTQD